MSRFINSSLIVCLLSVSALCWKLSEQKPVTLLEVGLLGTVITSAAVGAKSIQVEAKRLG